MRRFCKTIILFFLPLLLVLCGVEYCLRQIPNDYSLKANWLDQHIEQVQILTFGSSHGYFGLHSYSFSLPAFNAAHVTQTLKYDDYILSKYIDRADSLKYVVVLMSYFSLTKDLEHNEEWWRVKNYCIRYGCPYHRFEPKFRTEIFGGGTMTDHLTHIAQYYFAGKDHIVCDTLGNGHRNDPFNDNGAKNAWYDTYSADPALVPENKQYVEHIISLCGEDRHVILLTTPTYHTYHNNIDPQQFAAIQSFCDSLAMVHPNVHYLNLFRDERFTPAHLYDAEHLNDAGAELLTKIVDAYILTLE